MERESNAMQPMCRSGCGFYGNPAQDGLCSVCYKDLLRKKQQPPVSSTPSSNNSPQPPAPGQSVTTSSVSIRPAVTPQSFASTIVGSNNSSTTTTSASSASVTASSPAASSCAASANNPAAAATFTAQATVHSALFCSDKDEEIKHAESECFSGNISYEDVSDTEDEDVVPPNVCSELCEEESSVKFQPSGMEFCYPLIGDNLSYEDVSDIEDEEYMREEIFYKINTDDSGSLGGHSNSSSIADNEDKDGDKEDAKKKKNRCATCRKKVGLTGFECRCGGLFCAMHRYSDKHECSFDYRELGAAEIRRNNPVVVGEKIQKI